MRKFYHLFILLIVCSSTINAQFIPLESGTIKGMSSDGKYVLGNGKYYLISEDGTYTTESVHSSSTAISSTGRIVGILANGRYIVELATGQNQKYDYDLPTAAYQQAGETTWTTLPLYLRDDVQPDEESKASTSLETFLGDYPAAISDDGSIIVGGFLPGTSAPRKQAGYWTISSEEIQQIPLENDLYGAGSMVYGISKDGKIMGGYYNAGSSFQRVAVLWIEDERMEINNIIDDTYISAVSNNGKYAALNKDGETNSAVYTDITPIRAGICNVETFTYTFLSSDESLVSAALGVSDNGIIVGYKGSGNNRRAFVYTSSRGMIDLSELLNELEIAYPENFIFYEVNAISADGHILSGYGTLNGVTTGFYITIPEIPTGVYSVENIQVSAPAYGKVAISWERPQDNSWSIELLGYEIYRDDVKIETTGPTATSYEDTVGDGTYTYYIRVVYDTERFETQPSNSRTITMGKLTVPYFDDFNGYTVESAQSLRDRKYWDVTANTVGLANTWQPQLSGYPPYCVEFQVPAGGVYEETLTSAFIDATGLESLQVNFVITISSSASHNLAIDVYDGTTWNEIDRMRDIEFTAGNFVPKRYDISNIAAGKDNVRVRFRAYGTGNGNRTQWVIDNLEIADKENALTHPSPLAVQVTQNEENNAVFISWVSPEGKACLRYADTDLWTASIVGNEGEPFIAANMYPAKEMAIYDGFYLTELSFMPSAYVDYDEDGREIKLEPAKYKWYVSQGEERLYAEDITGATAVEVTDGTVTSFKWFSSKLKDPIQIDGNKPLYYGVEIVYHHENDLPIATSDIYHTEIYMKGEIPTPLRVSRNVADGRGNIYSEDEGKTWKTLSFYYDEEFKSDRVYPLFNVSAILEKDPTVTPTLSHFTSYKALRNGDNLITERMLEGAYHTLNTTIVDFDYPHTGTEACYEIKAHYITAFDSDSMQECITVTLIHTAIDSYEKDSDGISVYPSPVVKGQSINIDLGEDAAEYTGNVKIYTSTGSLVKQVQITDRITVVDINFPAGIYFLQINDKVVKIAVE